MPPPISGMVGNVLLSSVFVFFSDWLSTFRIFLPIYLSFGCFNLDVAISVIPNAWKADLETCLCCSGAFNWSWLACCIIIAICPNIQDVDEVAEITDFTEYMPLLTIFSRFELNTGNSWVLIFEKLSGLAPVPDRRSMSKQLGIVLASVKQNRNLS